MDMTADFLSALAVILVIAGCLTAYLIRRGMTGPVSYERVKRQGGGPIVGEGTLNFGFWTLQSVGAALARAGIPADSITWAGLLFAAGSGWAISAGRFGVAALALFFSGACDALDGLVATLTNTKTPGGVVLDSTLDRYGDFALLVGAAMFYRFNTTMLALSLLAMHGSSMVSYATAKAEAIGKVAPGGSMKRPERLTVLLVSLLMSGITRPFWSPADAMFGWPFAMAVALVAVLSNISAARRLYFVWATAGDRPKS